MLTQEQAQGLNIQQHELEDAELQQARAQQEMDRYYDAIKKANDAMQNGTAEQREKIAGLLPRLTEWYNNAKSKRTYEEDRFWVATNKINEYRALDAAQQPTQWGGQKRRTITPPEPTVNDGGNWWPIITPVPFDELPENIKRIIRNQPGNPFGSITEWPGIWVWDYLEWAWNGFTDTYLDPSEFVYQSNSRQPWYNFWANLWRAWTVWTILAWGYRLAAPESTIWVTSAWTTQVTNPYELNLWRYNWPVQQTWNYGRVWTPSTFSMGNPALTNAVNRNVSNNLARTVSNTTLSNRLPNGTAIRSLSNSTMTPTNVSRFREVANRNPNASIAETVYNLATK